MKLISAQVAFLYAKQHYPVFPSDWFISPHFRWNDVFVYESKEDGIPPFQIFENAVKMANEEEKARVEIGKPFNVHCWYRSPKHKLRMIAQGYKPATHSAHDYAMAIDFDVIGMTPAAVRAKEVQLIKQGKLKVRIEANTLDWIHNDIGNVFTKDYKWGVFNV